jgi:aryl-alcohol dehydrogenase-like predicted oxidoreductase
MTARKLGHSDLQFTISDLIKEGEVRYAGVSNASVEQLECCSPPYSMLDRCFLFRGRKSESARAPVPPAFTRQSRVSAQCRVSDLGNDESAAIRQPSVARLFRRLRAIGVAGGCTRDLAR